MVGNDSLNASFKLPTERNSKNNHGTTAGIQLTARPAEHAAGTTTAAGLVTQKKKSTNTTSRNHMFERQTALA